MNAPPEAAITDLTKHKAEEAEGRRQSEAAGDRGTGCRAQVHSAFCFRVLQKHQWTKDWDPEVDLQI